MIDDLPRHLLERTRLLGSGRKNHQGTRVLYWTHHALRTDENPALDVAIHLSERLQLPLLVYQGLSEKYRFAADRHHTFILEAARELQTSYEKLGIAFAFHLDRDQYRSPRLAQLALSSAVVVTDDFPLEATKDWTERLAASNKTAIVVVDTACVVPMQLVGKAYERAFAFREATATLYRERVNRVWPAKTPNVDREMSLPFESLDLCNCDIAWLVSQCDIDHSVGPVSDTRGGTTAGYARWTAFRNDGLRYYAKRRNQIEFNGVSRMSAYLHYGMVSPFRLAREAFADRAEKFLDELLIWRELAYSFCHYRNNLDSDCNLPSWARASLLSHEADPRSELSWESLARGRTGERLWDAAQRSLLKHGELHNNLRMTWGKAILAWSTDHVQALDRLIDLNHRYALDGRDPASYGGILWCLGQFDRPFSPEQPILGNVRPRPIAEHERRVNLAVYEKWVDRGLADPSPRIAMIGAGLGGLMCSRILQDHGLDVQVYEKSHRAGGRASTRKADQSLQFDHGAQYFTIRNPHWEPFLESWIADNHVARWTGRIGAINSAGQLDSLPSVSRFVGTPAMESLAKHLASELNIHISTAVASVSRSERGYKLLGDSGHNLGNYDCVLFNCPPKQIISLLPAGCNWQDRIHQVPMVPCWAVMVALENRWELPFEGAFVNCGNLSWIARDSSKPARASLPDTWVLHSTLDWAENNINLTEEQAIECLIAEAECVTLQNMPRPSYAAAHRWKSSRPKESLPEASLWDERNWLGACGDWCRGPRIEGSITSGMALAGRVLGALHQSESTQMKPRIPQQLTLFDEMDE